MFNLRPMKIAVTFVR